ncbi:four-helix bundle copper-binding protein [Lysinibacillus sphaericus]
MCDACATECEKHSSHHEHCKKCVEACKRCADVCRSMAS